MKYSIGPKNLCLGIVRRCTIKGGQSQRELNQLPARTDLGQGEALDSYLERIAALNDLRSSELTTLILTRADAERGASTTFAMFRPEVLIVRRVAGLTGLNADTVQRATLTRFDQGRPLHLAGLEASDPRTLRPVAAQGWLPGYGSQMCPYCLRDDGQWHIQWRLRTSTICLLHKRYLVAFCSGCNLPPRMQRRSMLRTRPWPDMTCDNPLGNGSRCPARLDQMQSDVADISHVSLEERLARAYGSSTMAVNGEQLPAAAFLMELKHLSVLLLHLAGQPGARETVAWSEMLAVETATRTRIRGPRWSLTPPTSPWLRATVLQLADDILSQSSAGEAADKLAAWTRLAPTDNDGPLGWLADRTTMSPVVSSLVLQSLAPHRRVSALLAPDADRLLGGAHTPALITPAEYAQHFAALLGTRPATGQLYVSLCLARRDPAIRSWALAAEALGVPGHTGTGTARTASARLLVPPAEFAAAVSTYSGKSARA